MGAIEILRSHRRIMLDTSPFIYFIEQHQKYFEITDEIFKLIRDDFSLSAFSSIVTLVEVLTQPLKENNSKIAEKYRHLLLHSENFTTYSIDSIIAEKAAVLRARYDLKTPDALQLATAIENNATMFITNDSNLKKVKEIEILVLKDYL